MQVVFADWVGNIYEIYFTSAVICEIGVYVFILFFIINQTEKYC